MMPGQNSNNFEKIKKEINTKKHKAEAQNKGDSLNAENKSANQAVQTESKIPAKKNKTELVVFRVGEEEFAFELSIVKEIIRVPSLIKVPNAPEHISGLCVLRGEILPVVDTRKLFCMPEQELSESSRIIVADISGEKAGLISDKVSEVISVDEAAVKEAPDSIRRFDGGIISGLLILNDGKRVVMLLDAAKVFKEDYHNMINKHDNAAVQKETGPVASKEEEDQIVVFNIGTEEYAFNINYVKEIIRLPKLISIPDTEDYIEGVFSIRNELLAVINLGRIFGISCKQPDENSRVVIVNNGSFSYGVIVDKVSHVIRVRKKLLRKRDQIAYCSGIEFVKGIYDLNNGKRLIMLLEPHKLIKKEDIKTVLDDDKKTAANDKADETDSNLEHLVVFKLGGDEYGININNVQEINRMSEITHYPGAPAYIAGMVDLRGDIIPILNLKKLLALCNSDSNVASKFLVVEFENKRIGIMIDSVSGLLRIPEKYIEKASELFKERGQNSYVDRVAKLKDGDRIVLLLNFTELFSYV